MYVRRILLSICRLFLDLFVIFKLFLSEIKERIKKKPLFMAVNKDSKNSRTNRPELHDLQNTNL